MFRGCVGFREYNVQYNRITFVFLVCDQMILDPFCGMNLGCPSPLSVVADEGLVWNP